MDRVFWQLALAHLAVWVAVPALIRPNPPLDTVEMFFLGHEWPLGDPKHPPLACWITEAVGLWSGRSMWAGYLVSQVAVMICFWAAYRLAREIVSPRKALLSVCLLMCCAYYNLDATDFSQNVCLYPWWALAVLFFYRALQTQKTRDWVALGICAGLGLLSKYTMGVLLLTMLGFLCIHPAARRAWRSPGPYWGMLVAFMVFGVHFAWMLGNKFCAVHYIAWRTQGDYSVAGRIVYPLMFAASQAVALLPAFLAALPVTGFPWRFHRLPRTQQFDRQFLAAMTFGPFLVCLLLSLGLNLKLHTMYGSQMWTFAGLLMLVSVHTQFPARWHRTWAACALVALGLVAATVMHDVCGPYVRGKASRVNFPGRDLASQCASIWEQKFHRPLPAVSGDYWLAGNVAFHAPSRPTVYPLIYDDKSSLVPPTVSFPWIDDDRFRKSGGIFLWDMEICPGDFPMDALRKRFPAVEPIGTLRIPYRTSAPIAPAEIGVAILAPGRQQGE